MASLSAFAALRDALDVRYRTASSAAFVQAQGTVLATGLESLDRALSGGFPKGAISTLEGAASSGRTALSASLLATASADGGAAALVDWRDDPAGSVFAPSLAAAGVALERLLIVRVGAALDVMRAADILLRSGAFGAVVIPAVSASSRIGAATWTRLANLAHRADAVLLVVGSEISTELSYFASLRVECALERTLWDGAPGLFRRFAGYELCAQVRKHKRAAPGGEARLQVEATDASCACSSRSSETASSRGGSGSSARTGSGGRRCAAGLRSATC